MYARPSGPELPESGIRRCAKVDPFIVDRSQSAATRYPRLVGERDGERSFDEVLQAAEGGETEALRLLYKRLAAPVAAYLRGRGCPDVDDVTSEVLISVFTGLRRFSGNEGDFRAWVFTIARRRWIDEQRRAGRRVRVTAYDPRGDPRKVASAEDEALSRAPTDVWALLARLSPEQREVLELRLVADLPAERVAVVMNKQPNAIRALQRRGLATLRRLATEADQKENR